MTATNDFLPFAIGGGANVLTQPQYAALTAILSGGYQSGVANSAQMNKTWRQSSIMSAVVAQFIVNQTGQNATDDGTTATLLANLATAISVSARQNPVLTDTGTANAYAVANLSAFSAYPTASGLTIDVSILNANTGASTLAVDGLSTKPILGLGLQPLQGGELIVKGVACLMYIVASTVNSGNGAWILMECAGGAQQVAAGTQSNHAVNLGQFVTSLSTSGYAKIPNASGLPLIIQWFSISNTGGTTSSGTFPLAFPNNCFAVTLTGLQATGNTQAYSTLNSKTLSGFNWSAFSATGGSVPSLAATSASVQGFGFAIGN
ncbi:hypothetical protein PQR64_26595 [Paraburkholderia phytofirmans]|uniref:gp53-like domain-containing protein n=1 Tax=Paraburkholderia phytofirmans TaxID=261302 RepID=UPI0038BA8557